MNNWACRKCDKVFRTRRLLLEHRKQTHKPEDETQYSYTYNKKDRTYTCNTCDTEVQTLPEITAHLLCHQEKISCGDCNQDFPNAYKYSVHVQREHSIDGLYRCPTCEYVTPRVTAILQHINRTHLKKYPHYCGQCGKGFGDAVISKEHENIHLGLKPFTCVVCNKDFAISKYLLMHQVKNHVVTVIDAPCKNQCHLCGKEFSAGLTLEKHLKRHATSGIPKPKTHLCDICGKGFGTKDKLTIHYRTHTGYKPYKCSYCEKCFTKKDYLVMHERVHSGEKPYSCGFCGKSFSQDSSLRIHVRSHTGEKPYPCHLCSNKFASKGAMKCHLKSCQGSCTKLEILYIKTERQPRKINKLNKWNCTKCDKILRTKRLLLEHKRQMHKAGDETQYSYIYNKKERNYTCNTCDMEVQTLPEITAHVLGHQEKINCGECDQHFPSAYKYSVHVQREHSIDGLYRCPMCEYITSGVTAILQHINRIHLKKFPHYCKQCGKGFSHVVIYKEHENIHLGLKPFTCVVCNKSFAISKYLLKHQIKNHTVTTVGTPRKIQCHLCEKKFSARLSLEAHLKRHATSGNPKPKPHLCDICGKNYATKDKLTIHHRTHTGYKPYKCSYCEKCFTKKESLVRHERVHSGEKPYSCEFCGRRFSQDTSLRIHVRRHTGEKPYSCHLCGNKYSSKTALNSHLKSCKG